MRRRRGARFPRYPRGLNFRTAHDLSPTKHLGRPVSGLWPCTRRIGNRIGSIALDQMAEVGPRLGRVGPSEKGLGGQRARHWRFLHHRPAGQPGRRKETGVYLLRATSTDLGRGSGEASRVARCIFRREHVRFGREQPFAQLRRQLFQRDRSRLDSHHRARAVVFGTAVS